MRILVVNGPNLNMLGKRDDRFYGDKTLSEISELLDKTAASLDVEVTHFQSNSEGEIIDFIQNNNSEADGIIINPGALTHYGYSLYDALLDSKLPVIEVHLSNIYSREDWRAKSIIAPVVKGQISGLGWLGYIFALQFLANYIKGEICD
jgi:3-dehydroquinate dehydratase-2